MANHDHGNAISGHSHGGGDSAVIARENQRRLLIILSMTLGFAGVEVAGGLLSGSLALLADAGHMVTDSSALALSLLAVWLSRRSATRQRTYGFRKAEFLAAFVNALGLVVLAIWIVYEAVQRIESPTAVLGGLMFWVALAGLVVNLVAISLLLCRAATNLNIKSALFHVGGDLLGSVGALGAAVIIYFTGWTLADPLVSLLIAGLISVGGARILFDSSNRLLDQVPSDLDTAEIERFLLAFDGVRQVCDLHAWSVSSTDNMLTAHLVINQDADREGLQNRVLQALNERFNLAHTTLQLETEPHSSCREEW